ncbi:hypothetical protein JCGZ_04370 [Jatropha curcas]|uniref:Uncharacterized protein n=1 Tax=Jatropha curcas TaxID=180498 RepID=A0A067L1T2_JATCU|nr:uncharacterized protein LOC105633724 [Jatropha curcas]KDP38445.1 hypothetical protein JCGZ_04370 [Jatropha curcas]
MATVRLLRSCKPLQQVPPPGSTSSSITAMKCIGRSAGLGGEKIVSGDGDNKRKSATPCLKASAAITQSFIIAEPRADEGIIDLASLLAAVGTAFFKVFRPVVKRKPWKLQVQTLIEKAIIDCRFFILFAVAGSLLSSILCFVEGCFIIVESYFQYFSTLSHSSDSDQAHLLHLLIEAIDMFLVGTAMVIFGVGLYTIFVKDKGPSLPGSNFLKSLPTWVQVESVSQAKSKIGHAVLMILQVGLLEKFKNTPLVTSLDLACFAGAILVSSASTFLLSKLYVGVA